MKQDKKLEDIYELSPVQGGILFNSLYQPTSTAYFIQNIYELTGPLDASYWYEAWKAIVERYDCLRASFIWDEIKKPLQIIHKKVELPWRLEDWSNLSWQECQSRLRAYAQSEREKGFDLIEAPLMRWQLIKCEEEKHYFVWNQHHLITDGWSVYTIFSEVLELYKSFAEKKKPSLKSRAPYKSYITWLLGQDKRKAESYWRSKLEGVVPTKLSQEEFLGEGESGEYSLILTEKETESLNRYAKAIAVTPNTVLQGAWGLLLSRYTRQEDVVFGVTVSGRQIDLPGVEDIVGIFINTLPLRVQIKGHKGVKDYLKELQLEMVEAQNYSYLPLSHVQALQKEGGSGLFDNIYVYENYPVDVKPETPSSLSIKTIQNVEKTEYGLSLVILPQKEIEARFIYDGKRFTRASIERIAEHFKTLITLITQKEEEKVGNLSLPGLNELSKLSSWNETEEVYANHKCVHELFEENAEKSKDSIAAVCGNEQVTYEALNQKSNQLAHYLRKKGVTVETIVGICLPSNIDYLVGLLGVIKSGGAYIPLDPAFPKDRIDYMLQDAGAQLLITTRNLKNQFQDFKGEIVCLDLKEYETEPTSNVKNKALPHNLLYVLYTSGSTGKPKGALITHTSLINSTQARLQHYKTRGSFELTSSISFDSSMAAIYGSLIGQETLVLPTFNIWEVDKLSEELDKKRIHTVLMIPSLYASVLDYDPKRLSSLKQVIVAGESFSESLIDLHNYTLPDTALYNEYGPTECTVWASGACLSESASSKNKSHIGRPIANTEMHILDEYLNPVPIGVSGEIYIGGVGLARGYLGRRGLTAEKFVPNPFKTGERLYRTGDLGRYLEDGNIEFLGRIDHQVKIRGYRIELGEIETVLQGVPDVKQAVVLAREDIPGQKRLVAYVVSENEGVASLCREVCEEQLPEYMCPSQIVVLEALPLTPNGKIDRKALPAPEGREGLDAYEAPQGEIENKLASIWEELLGIEKVGRHDNFFHLGGDSIVCIQVSSRARQLGIKLSVKQIFETPVLKDLANVAIKEEGETNTLRKKQVMGSVPLLPIQRQFFEQSHPNYHHYNQAAWLRSNKEIEISRLQQAFDVLYKHHDAFRLRYRKVDSGWEQFYSEELPLSLEVIKKERWKKDELPSLCTQIQSSLNIEKGPLCRVVLFEGNHPSEHKVFWVIHHLIVDGVSWRLLLDDLNRIYAGKPLLPKTHTLQDWANHIATYELSEDAQLYYQAMLQEKSSLPIDQPCTDPQSLHTTEVVDISFDSFITKDFLQFSHRAYNTQANDLLLAALVLAVGDWCGDYKLCLDLEAHGRETLESDFDATQILGWFTTIYPVLLHTMPKKGLGNNIKSVKEQLREIPDKGITYSVASILHKKLRENKNTILFNYLGQWDAQDRDDKVFNFDNTFFTGDNVSLKNYVSHNISINGGIQEGKLHFTWRFTKHYETSAIERLAKLFQKRLINIVNYCKDSANFGYTPSDFPLVSLTQDQLDAKASHSNVQDILPLTPTQQGLLFQSLIQSEADLYFIQNVYKISGDLNEEALYEAWNYVINRYDALKAAFYWQDIEESLQLIHKEVTLPWNKYNWVDISEVEEEASLNAFLERDRAEPFDLSHPPLMRWALIKRKDYSYLIWSQHHLLTDGWSLPIILSEVYQVYESLLRKSPISLVQRRPFRDYLGWLKSQDHTKAEDYWQKQLANIIPTKLNGEPLEKPDGYKQKVLKLSQEKTAECVSFARSAGITLSTFFEGCWGLLLAKLTSQDDVVFGVTISGRQIDLPGIDQMVGIFINTLPLRIRIKADEPLHNYFKRIQSEMADLQNYSYASLSKIQALQKEGGTGLFDTSFAFQNYLNPKGKRNSPLCMELINGVEKNEQKLWITIHPKKSLEIKINYDLNYFDDAFVDRLQSYLKQILNTALKENFLPVGNVSLMNEDEKTHLLAWNSPQEENIKFENISQIFEKVVEKHSDKIALEWESKQISYAVLNEKSNQLGHYLRNLGVETDVLVGLSLPRSIDFFIAMLGILKSGGGYVPLDPELPHERLEYIISDCQLPILITHSSIQDRLPSNIGMVLCIDELWEELSREEKTCPSINFQAEQLTYVIYTSGSTGRPKGVGVTHKNLFTYLNWAKNTYVSTLSNSVPLLSSPFFDMAVTSIYVPLLSGQKIVILPEDFLEIGIEKFLQQEGQPFDFIKLTPGHLKLFENSLNQADFKLANKIILGGETLTFEDISVWRSQNHDISIFNEYGPTEITVACSIYEADEKLTLLNVPIGKAIPNYQIYILDQHFNLVPRGCVGEIYIGGLGLARSYINKPSLTAERFVPNPFVNSSSDLNNKNDKASLQSVTKNTGQRLYKTGDLGRLLPDGNIEFLGRDDHQVKIRGYRIELSEIECVLKAISSIKQAVVLAREDIPGQKRLVAYVVSENEGVASLCREVCEEQLPEYMYPSQIVVLEALPLTPNGKIDRKALPAPEGREGLDAYEAPQGEIEIKVASIWEELLGIEKVGRHDNFFHLGGHSLLATRLIAKIRKELSLEVPLKAVFESPRLKDLAEEIGAGDTEERALPPIERVERTKPLPLSFAQQRLWFLEQLMPGLTLYHIPFGMILKGPLNIPALEESLLRIVERHESLRTKIVTKDGTAYQEIVSPEEFSLRKESLSSEEDLSECIKEETGRPFNFDKEVLFRALLLKVSKEEHVLVLTFHHMVSDGWSMSIFFRELEELYGSLVEGKEAHFKDLPIQYADFSVWQREWLQGEVLEKQLAYWQEKLYEASPINLPSKVRPETQSFEGRYYEQVLSRESLDKLNTLSKAQGVTLFMLLLSVFKGALSRCANQSDIVIGTPIANRRLSEVEGLIGFFINTLALRTDCGGNPRFKELLKRVEETTLSAYEHQDVPFEQLVDHLKVPRDLSRHPIFQVMFVLQNAGDTEARLGDLEISPVGELQNLAKFDLALNAEEREEGLYLSYEYATDIFTEEQVKKIAGYYEKFIEAVLMNPEVRLSEVEILDKQEKVQLISWNETQSSYPQERMIHELFEERVASQPDAVAVISGARQLSYGELNRRANQVGHYLRREGVRSESLVGICLERSFELIIGLLGTLKAGGAYVPFDPEYPEERLSYMLEDAGVEVLLTTGSLKERFKDYQGKIICLDEEAYLKESSENLTVDVHPENLAYVIYTSGSTGKPKGVAVTHKGLINLTTAQKKHFLCTSTTRTLQFASFSFDASVSEWANSLSEGGCLVIHQVDNVEQLPNTLQQYQIGCFTLPPSVLEVIDLAAYEGTLVMAGEAAKITLFKQYQPLKTYMLNAYGPTETTICASIGKIADRVHIGRPIENIQIHILDEYLNPVPIGVSGEIYIGGVGLARGYLGRRGLTAEKFVPNPFKTGERLYRTGDLGRYLEDGNIEFLGRIDHQVKIRGYRIELGEIETVLQGVPDVKQAVVLAREDIPGQKRLVAYVVSENEGVASLCREVCEEQLPEYMCPSQIVVLEALPLTPNGKIDRKALPAPEGREGLDAYEAPQGEIENKLASIWEELLGIEKVGRHDNFFHLGGHSLLATRLIAKIRKELSLEVPLKAVFESPRLKDLAEGIGEGDTEERALPPIEKVERTKPLPLSFAQQRLWFLEQLTPGLALYHMTSSIKLRGKLDVSALEESLLRIVERHESLRTKIVTKDGTAYQEIVSPEEFSLRKESLSSEEDLSECIKEETGRPFNFDKEVLFRALLLKVSKEEHVLVLTFHHMVSDGWSMSIFFRELEELYGSLVEGKEAHFKDLPIQYADFSVWQREWLQGEVLEKQLAYWQEKLYEASPINLPSKVRPETQSFEGRYYEQVLSRESLDKLNTLSKAQGVTLFMLLLSVFKGALSRCANQSDIVIGTPIANRRLSEVEGLIGFFINTLALRTDCGGNPRFKELLKRVEETTLSAYEHQDVPFEQLVDHLKVPRDLSRHPIFQVMFVLQNAGDTEARLGDLEISPVGELQNLAKFDLALNAEEREEGLYLSYEYATDIFTEEQVKKIAGYYEKFIEAVLMNPEVRLSEVEILDKQEKVQLISWNETQSSYPQERMIHELFEERVASQPDAVAVISGVRQLSYGELNRRANQVGHYLRREGVQAESLVGVCLERSFELIIGLLGTLKAGGAYVPFDPEYPEERLAYMLEDAGVEVLLTTRSLKERFKDYQGKIICLDEEDYLGESSENLTVDIHPENLAYVIYTSGSTGKPKGVAVTHKSVFNLFATLPEDCPFEEGTAFIPNSSISFDPSVWHIFGPLCLGGHVLLVDYEKDKDGEYIAALINTHRIRLFHGGPSLVTMLLQTEKFKECRPLKSIVGGGEAWRKELLLRLKEKLPDCKVTNVYGPTEATIHVTSWKSEELDSIDRIPIGKPIANTEMHILDEYLNAVPIGVSGEIYIGGVGLARGYLGRRGLTAEKFVPNPFKTGERLYRTGDLGRYLEDGNIEFLGRIDHQVKIRGYRIELGEIETVLQGVPDVKQAVVLAREDIPGQKRLVAYVVSENEGVASLCREVCEEQLPEYMCPSQIVVLEALPLTPNGKIDRKALPAPEFTASESYVAPRNELERRVSQVWAEVLGLPEDKISIQDDFFRLGGDSIISIQLISRLRQKLELTVSVKDIFVHKTIERLYDHVLSKESSHGNKLVLKTEQGLLDGEVPLLPIQEWFFESNFVAANHWNQSFIIKTSSLDLNKLQASIGKLVQRHDSFRLKYKKAKSQEGKLSYIQYYDREAKEEELKVLDVRTLRTKEGSEFFTAELQEILTEWQSGFNLEEGPTYSIGYLYGYADGSARLYFALHHLIVDSVSWRILTEDLRDIYEGKDLGSKGSSYRQWVETVKEYASTHENEKDYWENVISDYNHHRLTSLIPHKETQSYARFTLSREQTQKLLRDSNRAYHTQVNDILLTALAHALSEVTGDKSTHIMLEGHGREEIDESIDITRTLGWFTTMYPVRLEIYEDLGRSLKNIKETLRQVPNKGIGYGALIGYQQETLPRISFNYLGQFDKEEKDKSQSLWNIIDEPSGIPIHAANQEYNILNINGLVIDGELKFGLGSKLDQKTTTQVSNLFKRYLINIIEHTIAQKRSFLTGSDVDNVINQDYLDRLQESREVQAVYLANSLQQGFIYHALSQGEIDEAYRVQATWQYKSKIDIDKLKEAWTYAQKRYGSLRLRFAWEEELVQVIDKEGSLDWNYIDLSHEQDPAIQEKKINQIQENDRAKTYKLENGGLFRIYLIKQREELYTFIFSNHHAILDGWSGPLLFGYVHETYQKLLNREKILLSEDRSYEEAQKYLQLNQDNNKEFWNNYLQQIEERSDLNSLLESSKRNIKISEYRQILYPEVQSLTLQDELYYDLKKLSQENGVTLNAILQYVWHKIVSIYGNSSQTTVGTTVSGRHLPIKNIEYSVGLYINTLPLFIDHKNWAGKNILEQIKEIQAYINEVSTRSDINLAKIQKGGERLFDSIFVYENYPTSPNEHKHNSLGIRFTGAFEKLDYPLTVTAYELSNQLVFKIDYAGELFSKDNIVHLLLVTKRILEQIANNPSQYIYNLSYLHHAQYNQIVKFWNQTEKDYPSDKTIHELFEEQVESTPDNIAVVYEEIRLTYRELNERANQLSHYLRDQGVGPDTLVAIAAERSLEMVVAVLGVLKAGGAYVPLDPAHPKERLQYMLQDTKAPILITLTHLKTSLVDFLSSYPGQLIALDEQSFFCAENTICEYKLQRDPANQNHSPQAYFLQRYSKENLSSIARPYHLAYVIYTSGSTGKPKGVMISHKALSNRLLWMKHQYGFTSADRILQKTTFTFDVSVWEILMPLLSGAQLILAKAETYLDFEYMSSLIKDMDISCFEAIPSFIGHLLEQDNLSDCLNLRAVIAGSESLPPSLIGQFHLCLPHAKLYNSYGPTEATIDVTLTEDLSNTDDIVSIGKPIANTEMYILDEYLNPVPIGVSGEIYIGGVGLARGYLGRRGLTAEKFVPNPFKTGERLYRTGDLGRYLEDGNIEFLGRIDHQVKIRGYRIELGEIETVLQGVPDVKQAVVLAREDIPGQKRLVAYVVSENEGVASLCREVCEEQLPEYMCPSQIVVLEALPLTPNGKIDRKALPAPEFTASESYVAPRNELERRVSQVWAEVLGLPEDKISIQDDFFRLGGDSIISIQLISRLRQKLELTVSVKDIFVHKTIERLYDHVLSKESSHGNKLVLKTEQGLLDGEVPLLPIQEWFFESNFVAANHWNQSFIIKTSSLDLNKLQASIGKLVQRHDSFRLKYKKAKSQEGKLSYIQYYDREAKEEELKVLDVRTLRTKEGSEFFTAELQEILTEWQSGFNLEEGPTYSIGYLYGYADGSARLYFALHHLIVDSVSWRILTEDLRDIYEGKDLGSKGSSYRQWVETVKEYASTHENEKDYWENVISDYNHHRLTSLIPHKETQSYARFTLSREQTQKLLRDSNRAYHTQVNDILLTALAHALSEVTGDKSTHIMLEGHGREEIDESIDITRTLGWFTTMYPVRLEIYEDLGRSLKNIKETLRQVPNKGIGYGALIGYQQETLPRISFNYLGQFDKEEKDKSQSLWNIIDEPSGIPIHAANQEYNILNINGLVIDGELKFGLGSKLDQKTTTQVSNLFKRYLINIIEHCKERNTSEYTISDFDDFEPYIVFNEEVKDKTNKLFIFPPGEGGAESYINTIIPKLDDLNIIAFNNYYLYLEEKLGVEQIKDITFEKLAEDYICYMKALQPEGPYNLFGWSFGGVLSFEIAKQLLRYGDEVANVILVDSQFNYKKAVFETGNSSIMKDNINYKYTPTPNSLDLNANIVLFKALRPLEYNAASMNKADRRLKNEYKIFKYYAESTQYNNLDDILEIEQFRMISMDFTHESWIQNEPQIVNICSEVKELMKSSALNEKIVPKQKYG